MGTSAMAGRKGRVDNTPRGMAERMQASLDTCVYTDVEKLSWPCPEVWV